KPRSLIVATSAEAEPPIPPMRNPNGAGTSLNPSASALARDMKLNHAPVSIAKRVAAPLTLTSVVGRSPIISTDSVPYLPSVQPAADADVAQASSAQAASPIHPS